MTGYYAERLSGERLQHCYDLAPPRVRQYLEAEIIFVLERIRPSDLVLELGCGYGRVLERLISRAGTVVGIDTSHDSLALAREKLGTTCHLAAMDAIAPGFPDGQFDRVVCIQNGISAFHADQRQLLVEATRVTRSGGTVLFSSYAEAFWDARLHWFRLQSEQGLVGEIDEDATGNGIIVCKDGFQATTVGEKEFVNLVLAAGLSAQITEVDESSLFCEIEVP
ncbi:MAG: class I SAM-dependent methyltransferase [Fidelibacterota bacterium]|nr:MAG: class I SAM-dependent methyltransferase [Candidatus Neomarinimicrobiota bacterium]